MGTETQQKEPPPIAKKQPGQRQGHLSAVNSFVNFVGVVAVAWGVWIAKDTLGSMNESVSIAGEAVRAQLEQLEFSRQQFTAARDALWLDQRPWLAFSRAETVPAEIAQGGGGSFRFHILNTGKTPAFNVKLLRSRVRVYSNSFAFSEPTTWIPTAQATTTSVYTNSRETTSVFPNSTVYYDIRIPPILPTRFEDYTTKHFYVGLAARLEYCDANGSLHWTQLGVAKVFSETELTVQHNTASLHPGEPGHPDCQDEASEDP